MTRAFLGLGSNLGDRGQLLDDAVDRLVAVGRRAVSPRYETDPVGGPEQGAYLNLVVELDTDLSPRQLLEVCRLVYDRWLTNAGGSNFSGRLTADSVLLTSTGNAKRTRLQMDPDDRGPELLHLPEVADHALPLGEPVVLEQPVAVVAVVVEAPRHEGLARLDRREAVQLRAAKAIATRNQQQAIQTQRVTAGTNARG